MAGKLQAWFPQTTSPFICNAPMFGFANSGLAVSVTRAGGFGIWKTVAQAKKFTNGFLFRVHWGGS